MHELSVAVAVVESVEDVARRHGAVGVESVHVRVGELSGVVADALRFSFELAAEGTLLAGARLDIEEIAAVARCEACDTRFTVGSPPDLTCPGCGAPAADVLAGRELEVGRVELTAPESCPAAAPSPDPQEASA
ncbi:hydrogenase maturation nickel metallochaperone HypA [Streptomyces sp. NPDC008313]|uniref:hydrogenase maturation nickel metallochaperone HypA n=1 Tax=Streptomyces sp. NPDC008313 TaxID=3364826 RepID=UPI0036E9E817